MYKFWYDYVKPKCGENTKLYYMDTDSFIVHAKKQMIYIKVLQKLLKQDLILQILNQTEHYLMEKIKN